MESMTNNEEILKKNESGIIVIAMDESGSMGG